MAEVLETTWGLLPCEVSSTNGWITSWFASGGASENLCLMCCGRWHVGFESSQAAATEAAMLYFILTHLSAIDHMYRYSLSEFTGYFFKAMETASQPDDPSELEQRVDLLSNQIRKVIILWVSRGLKPR